MEPLHFKQKAGELLAIMRCPDAIGGAGLKLTRISVLNNWTAYTVVKTWEQRADFYTWAVDPFTGVANAHAEVPKMNE